MRPGGWGNVGCRGAASVELGENECRALFRRGRIRRLVDGISESSMVGESVWGWLWVDDVSLDRGDFDTPAPGIDRESSGDGQQPGRHAARALGTEPRERSKGPQERLLRDILDVVPVADQAPQDGEDQLFGASQKESKSQRILGDAASQELTIKRRFVLGSVFPYRAHHVVTRANEAKVAVPVKKGDGHDMTRPCVRRPADPTPSAEGTLRHFRSILDPYST
jgi:hypothetical protein